MFLTGAFQDEQTGPQFTAMIDEFTERPVLRVGLWNGRHPDGYGPQNLNRWFEFLELYVAHRVPVMNPLVRSVLPGIVADTFELDDVEIEGDRFAGFGSDLAGARAAYEAEQPVRVVFESGAGADEPGEQRGTFELDFDEWPPPAAEVRTWYLAPGGRLSEHCLPADPSGRHVPLRPRGRRHRPVPDGGYPLFDPTWSEAVWSQFADGDVLSYLTDPFGDDVVFAGPGRPSCGSPATYGAPVMVTVSEVRPTAPSSWCRTVSSASASASTPGAPTGSRSPTTSPPRASVRPGPASSTGRWWRSPPSTRSCGPGRSCAYDLDAGRNFAAWAFDNPNPGGGEPVQRVERRPRAASAVRLTVLPGIDVPDVAAPAARPSGARCAVPTRPRANHTAPA